MIRDALYQLKIDWGVLVDVYKLTSSETNYDTLQHTENVTRTRVRRAVKMPASTLRSTYVSPYFTQTNKPFITKGSGWDEVTDVFIFDGRDLRNYDWDLQDWIVHDHVRYEVKEIEEMGDGAGWAILTTLAKGSPVNEIHVELVEQDLDLDDDATGATT